MSYMTLKTLTELAESVGYQSRINTTDGSLEYHDEKEITDHKQWTWIPANQFIGMVVSRKFDMSLSQTESKKLAEGTELNQIEDKS